jgi:hypothetical protein
MAAVTWKVVGDYFEGCNCDSTCPCIFLADPDQGDCKLTIAWHIEKGHHGLTRLDGLNVAGIYYTPGNMVSGPKWRAALYLDERANRAQAEALGKIFSGQAGGFLANVAALIGEVMGVRAAPIEFEANNRQRRLRIPGALTLEVEGIAGADANREALVVNPALYGAAGFDPVIARSTRYTLTDHGMEWDNSGKNAFYSRFAYEGDSRL